MGAHRFRRWCAAALVLPALIAASCSGAASPATTTLGTLPTTTTTSLPPVQFGYVHELLNQVAPSFGIPAEFGGDRARVSPEFETQFVEAFRASPDVDGLAADLGVFSDDQLLYLGYVYCVGLDFEATALESLGVVAGTVPLGYGRASAEATDGDKAVAIAAAKYAGGSICGQYQPETDELLRLLRAG